MTMPELVTEVCPKGGELQAEAKVAPEVETTVEGRSRVTPSAAMNVQAFGLLMSATSLIGPILADGSY